MKIHHNTLAKAKKLGFSINVDESDHGVCYTVVRPDTKGPVWAIGSDAKETLSLAITKWEEWTNVSGNLPKALTENDTNTDKVIVMADHYRAKYRATGNDYCGDVVAKRLAEHLTYKDVNGIDGLHAIAIVNGIDMAKYSKLNNGMQRMNLGNRLRGLLRKGEDVIIGSYTIKAEDFDINS
tara:strand:- start:11702 stop:12244 length:543 start_codon:yes stop_codon:yes gene_type:complete